MISLVGEQAPLKVSGLCVIGYLQSESWEMLGYRHSLEGARLIWCRRCESTILGVRASSENLNRVPGPGWEHSRSLPPD